MSRNGYHDGAVAGVIGSQVINITLGIGLPSLFVCLTGRGSLRLIKHEAEK
jgi:Ca2+/Na+ antiporter